MDIIKEVFEFLKEHMANWSRTTYQTLIKPISRFELVSVDAKGSTGVIHNVPAERQLWLNPKLVSYVILSIILGLTINAIIPGRSDGPGKFASVLIIFIYWLGSGTILHMVCLLLRGKGKYLETLSVIIQVYSTLYVIASFLAILGVALLRDIQVALFVQKIPIFGPFLTGGPVFVFYAIQIILSMIYIPLSMKHVHKFGWGRTVIISIFPLLTMWVGVALYTQYDILVGAPPTHPQTI